MPYKDVKKRNDYQRDWRIKNKDTSVAIQRRYREKFSEKLSKKAKEKNQKMKLAVLQFYSKSEVPYCTCCGEDHIEFLTIDHTNGEGADHRRKNKVAAKRIYYWLIKNKFPDGFRVLCWNCNCSLGHFGYCPHGNVKVEKDEMIEIQQRQQTVFEFRQHVPAR